MITAMIIDDEPSSVKTLSLLLHSHVPEVKIIYTTNDPVDAVLKIQQLNPSLVFLDIQMPVLTGFDLLKKLPKINFNIIFTTAYDQYAIEAIRFSALDYLLKPIAAHDLREAIDRLIAKHNNLAESKTLYNNFMYNLNVTDKKYFKLALPTSEGTFFYKPAEIVIVEGINNYSMFIFSNNSKMLTSKTLKGYEEILKDHLFIRVSKSHLVNQVHIKSISTDGILTMTNNMKVEISRRRKESVSNALRHL